MTQPERAHCRQLEADIRQWANDRDLLALGATRDEGLDLLSEALDFADRLRQIAEPILVIYPNDVTR